jgi:hypothetical protein
MQPIVGGLEQQYGDKIAFLRVDASTGDGFRALNAAHLAGHPSYLILQPDGTELWRSIGVQSENTFTAAIDSALSQF